MSDTLLSGEKWGANGANKSTNIEAPVKKSLKEQLFDVGLLVVVAQTLVLVCVFAYIFISDL